MKKIAVLLALLAGVAYGGALTQTTAEVQTAVDNSLGLAILHSSGFTNTQSTTMATVVPPSGYTNSFAGSTDFTVNTNGTITCNFAGKVMGNACGSFNVGSGTADAEGHWFDGETDKGIGFVRSISGNTFGSFCSPAGALTVTNGAPITFRTKSASGTPDFVFHDLQIKLQRIE